MQIFYYDRVRIKPMSRQRKFSMGANGQGGVFITPHYLLIGIFLLILSGCGGGSGSGGSSGGAFTGSGGTTSGSSVFTSSSTSTTDFCNSPWVQPGPNCGGPGGTTPIVLPVCAGDQAGIIDACGQTITAVDLHDPVMMTMVGLTANTRYLIKITDPLTLDITPPGGFIATSDADGEINKAVIVQNMSPASELGTYTVSVAEEAAPGTVVQTLTYAVEDRPRVQCASDAAGTPQASFLAADHVFAYVDQASGTIADGNYNLYVISDVQKPLADGGLISGTAKTIAVAGGTGSLDLGTFSVGGYDVVVDINGNGLFDQGTDLISRHNRLLPCFAVQAANSGTVIVQQIASDKNGNKREIFDPNANIPAIRDVQAYLTPAERSGVQQPYDVDTYVVAHQATWTDGDPLTDVTGGLESSPVQDFTNNEAPWLAWSYSNLVAGCYDVVIDTNQNGLFDAGIDYVDNRDHLGGTVCGLRVSEPACTNVTLNAVAGTTPLADGDSTTSTAITVSGTISAPYDGEAYLTITSGTQSNTITITVSAGAYSANVPLFAGDNYITVSGVNGTSSCSKTITIRSVVDMALFRAQLTWDGSTDMDLHLVRPGGSYSNGGGGADDCNWANCKVGLAGTGTNSIDWGVTGDETDDPKLDVDCIACGNGIENIWMNQTTQDGVYKVYVDAYSGSETNVTVTINILGTAVGQVNCGSMASGTSTDSCYVGDITWAGGTAGIGSFTPVGTKASTF